MEIKNIQVVRGLAAMLVVTTHFFGNQLSGFSHYFGHMGVDIFFTLSGFLMVYCQNDNKGPKDFFVSRVKRIYPVYLILSLPMILSAKNVSAYMILGNFLLLPGLNDPDYTVINYPAWTLVYEMIFYVIFSLSLFISRKKSVSCLLTVALIFLSVYLFAGKYDKQGWVNLGYIAGDQLMLNFAIGCMIGLFYSKFNLPKILNFYAFIFITLILLYLALHVINDIRIIKLGVPSFIIIALSVFSKPSSGKIYDFLYILGGASYSIYLSHVYFSELASSLASKGEYTHLQTNFILCLMAVVAVIFGIVFYRFVEVPITKRLNPKRKVEAGLTVPR